MPRLCTQRQQHTVANSLRSSWRVPSCSLCHPLSLLESRPTQGLAGMPFISTQFLDRRLSTPLPVVDIFTSWRWLFFFRLMFQISKMLLYQLYPISFIFHRFGLNTIWVNILVSRYRLVPCTHSNWGLLQTASIRAFLVPNKPKRHFVWWGLYFICSDLWAFEHNYMEAWSQRSTNGAHLFVDDHYLRIPLPDNADDAETLIHLRMYYHLICARGSVSELLYIKQLERVDRVEVNMPVFVSAPSLSSVFTNELLIHSG